MKTDNKVEYGALKAYTLCSQKPLALDKTEAPSVVAGLGRIVSHQLVRPTNEEPPVMPNHEEVLSVLGGLRLRKVGRAADMLWMHFGDLREVPSRRGGTREVGEWSLHIQTSWRFTRRDRIIVGVLDLYAYAEDGSDFDWDRDGESRFDRIAAALNQSLRDDDIRVRQVACDEVGSITLHLDSDLHFAVFPNFSSDYPDREYWRLFQPATDHPHHVVSTDAPQQT